MNKPFTLEEYKKDPSRLRWSEKLDRRPKWSAIVEDKLCVIWDDEFRSIYYLPLDLPKSHSTLVLAIEYEVRRARPWHYRADAKVHLTKPPGDQSFAWKFVGPEFEYKVEV